MSTIAINTEVFRPHLPIAPQSALLEACLGFTTQLPESEEPHAAIPWDGESRRIERLKMARPQAAAQEADLWLTEALARAGQNPRDEEAVGRFASALSTWSGVRRTIGQLDDATVATHHALQLLCPRALSTRSGFACQRAALVLGDLGETKAGLQFAEQAAAIHQQTPGGERHVGTALAGLGAYHLSYRHAFSLARAAFVMALAVLPAEEEVLLVGASHGIAYCALMEGRFEEARESLLALRRLRPSIAPDQDLRLRWLEAEIAAGTGGSAQALALYDEIFSRTLEVTEPAGAVLVFFDAARLLLEQDTSAGEWWGWRRRLTPLVAQLTPAQRIALEPCLDALDHFELDRALLDKAAAAFKRAGNRMLLGLDRAA
ncbi:MAG: hypothetical protein AAFY88_00785 [Acidobacteriota bacterium]